MNNDQLISKAFSSQSFVFDKLNEENKLTGHLRDIYRKEIISQSLPDYQFLELNCGTGIDSIYLARKGFTLLSTDNSSGMIDVLNSKIRNRELENNIQTQLCSFNELYKLGDRKFNYIISNFGGLNCTKDLGEVLTQLKRLLKENGKTTLVIMPMVSPCELLLILKGDLKTAFRRFGKHTKAHIEGVHFSIYYYSPSYIIRRLKKDFDVLTLKGIYFAVPPEFYQGFVERYPRTYSFLQHIEKQLSNYFPFNRCCDHYLITLQKKK
jgi:ubiquinone/menaquinone biosynthesis C-methylase UbiE